MYINPWITPFIIGDPTTIFIAILLWVMTIMLIIVIILSVGVCCSSSMPVDAVD